MVYYEFRYRTPEGEVKTFEHPIYWIVKRRMKWLISRHCRFLGIYRCVPFDKGCRYIEIL